MAKEIGRVSHYYDKAGVAVVDLKAPLKVGETVTFQRGGNQFSQTVDSIQIEHDQVEKARTGTSVGVKVDEKVRPGTVVLRGAV
ncbi:MAG: hypothetical protein ABIH36_00015 [bacterium]